MVAFWWECLKAKNWILRWIHVGGFFEGGQGTEILCRFIVFPKKKKKTVSIWVLRSCIMPKIFSPAHRTDGERKEKKKKKFIAWFPNTLSERKKKKKLCSLLRDPRISYTPSAKARPPAAASTSMEFFSPHTSKSSLEVRSLRVPVTP